MKKYINLRNPFPGNLINRCLVYVDVLDSDGYVVLRELDRLGVKYSYSAYKEPSSEEYFAIILTFNKKYLREVKSVIIKSDREFERLGYSKYTLVRELLNNTLVRD